MRSRDRGRAWTALALVAAIVSASLAVTAVRPTARLVQPPAACAADGFQVWLSRATAAVPHGEAVEERAMLVVLDGLGRRRLDRHVIARALAGDDADRDVDESGLVAELDDAALTHVLGASPAFRRLVARPIRPRDPPPLPPVPQVLTPEAQLETANELLEALRETPRPAPRAPAPRPREPDVLYEAARFAVVLRSGEAKARAFLDVYARNPEVFRPVVDIRRPDPALPGQFGAAVERALSVDLGYRLRDAFGRLAAQLDAQGVPGEALEALVAQQPDTAAGLVRARWPFLARELEAGGWSVDVQDRTLIARQTLGHYALSVRVPVLDALVHAQADRWPDALFEARQFERVRDCHRSLCLPGRSRGGAL